MKKLSILFVMISTLVSGMAFANEGKDHPCKKIEEACIAAGFMKGGHKEGNKGLFLDCMKPIIKEGKTVAGVTVDPSVVQACQARKEKRHEAHEAHEAKEGKK